MISHSYIKKNLTYLDRVYRRTSSTTEASYCSKLAILELCGLKWSGKTGQVSGFAKMHSG